MKRTQRLPELLAPAGDFDSLVAAILGGADAVYVGGRRFGARALAKNFDNEELIRAVRLCHMNGVRLYVTVNTLVLDKELYDAVEFARFAYRIGVDALIVADLGLIEAIRCEVPDLELHASTQMGVHNTAGADFAYSRGCCRVVLARECSYEDICAISERSKPEIEVFVHGALCVCHSGQCLFSSMVGGRSGNRGECAQPCRLPYNGNKYPLSLSDLSLSNHIKELIRSGVSSLKIEGRMKSPSYVYEVTRIYRALLDGERDATEGEMKRLYDVFSRGDFTDGYFTSRIFSNMTGTRSEADKAQSRELTVGALSLPKLKVRAKASFRSGERSSLALYADVCSRWDNAGLSENERRSSSISVAAYGGIPGAAENSPLTEDGVKARLCKMGNTPFELSPDAVELELDEGINLAPSAINALRREAAQMLDEKFSDKLERILLMDVGEIREPTLPYVDNSRTAPIRSALFFDVGALSALLAEGGRIADIDAIFVPLFSLCTMKESERKHISGVYLPPVIMEHEWEGVLAELKRAKESFGVRYALVGNISHIALARSLGLEMIGDFRLNVYNRLAYSLLKRLGILEIILSPELTLPQARDVGGSLITMGRIPLMITERCFMKENFGCSSCSHVALADRKGARFPMMREHEHRNIIFNSSLTYMGDRASQLKSAGIRSTHFIFSCESAGQIRKLLSLYARGEALNAPHRRIGKREGL